MPFGTTRSSTSTTVLGAALIGAASGLRSQTGIAAVVLGADRERLPSVLRSGRARAAVTVAALGELGADKYPGAPPRTAPPSLAVRVVLGGAAGGILARSAGAPLLPAAVTAAAVAAGATFGGLALRTRLSRPLPAVAVALAEDAVAVGLATLAVRAVAAK
jgi:uncharacterized membrane protein